MTRTPAEQPAPGIKGHLPALDGVRGLAILMVLVVHFVGDTKATSTLERGLTWVASYGTFGVDLFFILSGFLITGILLEARGSRHYFLNFYTRRTLRIFPLYYGVLIAVFVLLPFIPALRGNATLGELRNRQWWVWLYGVNVLDAIRGVFSFSYLDHFWSLAVEEHFYALWPLLVWRCPPRLLLRIALAVSLTAVALRIGAAFASVNPLAVYVLTPFRLDALCLGGAMAVGARQPGGLEWLRANAGRFALAAAVVLLGTRAINGLPANAESAMHQVRNSATMLLLACLIASAVLSPARSLSGRFFQSSPMGFLGRYSYGLYVFHHFIAVYFIRHGTEFVLGRALGSHLLAVAIQAVVGGAASVALAMLSFHLFEQPFLRMKRYWPSPRDRAPPLMSAPGGPA